MPETDQDSHSLLVRTLENVAALNAKFDLMFQEVTQLRGWREDMAKQQQQDALRHANHERRLDALEAARKGLWGAVNGVGREILAGIVLLGVYLILHHLYGA